MQILSQENQAIVDKIAIQYLVCPLGFFNGTASEYQCRCLFRSAFRSGAGLEDIVFPWRNDAGTEPNEADTLAILASNWFGGSIAQMELFAPPAPPFNRRAHMPDKAAPVLSG